MPPTHLTPHEGNVRHKVYEFSPDSGSLLYGSDEGSEFMGVWRWEVATGAKTPLTHAENVKTPLLVIQGANDCRVPQVESDEIVAAVKANGTPVEYLVFPDEGHGFSRRENRIAASEAFVGFLSKHLQ